MPSIAAVEAALAAAEKESSKLLGVTLGEQRITFGQFVPRADAQKVPQVSFSGASGKYIVVCLDLEAPWISFNILGPILHWIQSGYEPSNDTTANGEAILKTSTPFIANYIGPAPPPGAAPHRYAFVLYEQPEDFDVKKHAAKGGKPPSNWNRMRYDLDAFAKEVKLGPILAANFFLSN